MRVLRLFRNHFGIRVVEIVEPLCRPRVAGLPDAAMPASRDYGNRALGDGRRHDEVPDGVHAEVHDGVQRGLQITGIGGDVGRGVERAQHEETEEHDKELVLDPCGAAAGPARRCTRAAYGKPSAR